MLTPLHSRPQRGTSITELLVALAIGAIVVAAALLSYAQQSRQAQRTLAQLRLEQDLRSAGEALLGEVRRSAYVAGRTSSTLVATPEAAGVAGGGAAEAATSSSAILEQLGMRLRGGVLQGRQENGGGWQPLTDPASLYLTRLEATESVNSVLLPVPDAGSPAADGCAWLRRQRIELILEARSNGQPPLRSTWRRSALSRNDRLVTGPCGGLAGGREQ